MRKPRFFIESGACFLSNFVLQNLIFLVNKPKIVLLSTLTGALIFAGCTPQTNSNTIALNPTTAPDTPTTPPSALEATPAPSNPRLTKTSLKQVWIPGSDDLLHAAKLGPNQGAPVAALNHIIALAPQFFPPKAEILGFKQAEGHYEIDLNAAFNDADFWSKNGEQTTELAIYALVNSMADLDDSSGIPTPDGHPVQFLVEGKKSDVLGESDISDPIPQNPKMNAKTPFQTPKTAPTKPSKPSKNAT